MHKATYLPGKSQNLAFSLPAALIIAADQLSKIWIRSNLAVGQSLFEIDFFRIIRVPPNTGAVFGLFQGQLLALTIVTSVIIAILLAYALFLYRLYPILDNMLTRVTLGLILGGAVGNLIDRLNPTLGGVTDFISIGWWPAFNIADSATTIGTIVFACSLLRLVRAERQ